MEMHCFFGYLVFMDREDVRIFDNQSLTKQLLWDKIVFLAFLRCNELEGGVPGLSFSLFGIIRDWRALFY